MSYDPLPKDPLYVPDMADWYGSDEAYKHVDGMLPQADVEKPIPAWHGWALREAFAAGAVAGAIREREACALLADQRQAQSRNHLVRTGSHIVALDIRARGKP